MRGWVLVVIGLVLVGSAAYVYYNPDYFSWSEEGSKVILSRDIELGDNRLLATVDLPRFDPKELVPDYAYAGITVRARLVSGDWASVVVLQQKIFSNDYITVYSGVLNKTSPELSYNITTARGMELPISYKVQVNSMGPAVVHLEAIGWARTYEEYHADLHMAVTVVLGLAGLTLLGIGAERLR